MSINMSNNAVGYEEVDIDEVKIVDNEKFKFQRENESVRVALLKNQNGKIRIFKVNYLAVNAKGSKDLFLTTRTNKLSPQMVEVLKPYAKQESRFIIPMLVYSTNDAGEYMGSVSLKPLVVSDNKMILFQQAKRNYDLTKVDIILQQQGTLKFQGFQVMPVPDRWVDINASINEEALQLLQAFDPDKMINHIVQEYTDDQIIEKFKEAGIVLPISAQPATGAVPTQPMATAQPTGVVPTQPATTAQPQPATTAQPTGVVPTQPATTQPMATQPAGIPEYQSSNDELPPI